MLATGEQLSSSRTLKTRRNSEEGVGLDADLENMGELLLFDLELRFHGEADKACRASHRRVESFRPVQVLIDGHRVADEQRIVGCWKTLRNICRGKTVSQHMGQSNDAEYY